MGRSVMKIVTELEIEALVIDAFAKKGARVSNVDILRKGHDGDWRIGQGVRALGMPYEALADEIRTELRKTYRLAPS